MKLFLLITLLSASFLQAQVNVIIEDERPEGFLLGVNGYLQNQEQAEALVITGLDTIAYHFSIKSGPIEFQKNIHLREVGTHKYVLTNDFYGKLKLRYRGLQARLPSGISSVKLSDEIQWPSVTLATADTSSGIPAAGNIIDSLPNTAVSVAVAKDSQVNHSIKLVTTTVDSNSLKTAEILTPGTADSLVKNNSVRPDSSAASDNQAKNQVFQSLINTLAIEEFEFERLRIAQEYLAANKIRAEQLGKLFEQLKYDQTRMQLTESAIAQVTDPENLPELSRYFEYEITKSKYILFLNE